MQLIPAIDLMDGQCVRLHKGDFDTQKAYSADPVSMARDFQSEGATVLHLVDLDGAKDPQNRQTELVKTIIAQTGMNIQTGGGIRKLSEIETLLDAGAERVVIGSLAVKEPEVVKEAFQTFGADSLCLALDVMPQEGEYLIATSGWQESSEVKLYDLIDMYLDAGLKHALCTDISKDGTLEGPNATLYEDVLQTYPPLSLQASGGIGTLDDLETLAKLPLFGCIVGKAIYENAFHVRDALALDGVAA